MRVQYPVKDMFLRLNVLQKQMMTRSLFKWSDQLRLLKWMNGGPGEGFVPRHLAVTRRMRSNLFLPAT